MYGTGIVDSVDSHVLISFFHLYLQKCVFLSFSFLVFLDFGLVYSV